MLGRQRSERDHQTRELVPQPCPRLNGVKRAPQKRGGRGGTHDTGESSEPPEATRKHLSSSRSPCVDWGCRQALQPLCVACDVCELGRPEAAARFHPAVLAAGSSRHPSSSAAPLRDGGTTGTPPPVPCALSAECTPGALHLNDEGACLGKEQPVELTRGAENPTQTSNCNGSGTGRGRATLLVPPPQERPRPPSFGAALRILVQQKI